MRIIPASRPDFHVREIYFDLDTAEIERLRIVHVRDIAHDVLRGDFAGDIGDRLENAVRDGGRIAARADLERVVAFIGRRRQVAGDVTVIAL